MRAAAIAARAVALRATFFWIALRCFLFAAAALMRDPLPHPFVPLPALSLVVPLLVLADARAMREDLFMANLGVGARHLAASAFAVTAALELACALLFADA